MARNKVLSIISDDYAQRRQHIESFTIELNELPIGSLFTRTTGNKKRYYRYMPAQGETEPARETYLGKRQEELIAQLARRKFVEMSLDSLKESMEPLKSLVGTYSVYDPEAIKQRMPKAYEGIECSIPSDIVEQNNAAWINEPYEKSGLWPDGLKHKSQNGTLVRSKSEAMIATQLEIHSIPYRYEQRLGTPDQSFYPDFTILNPVDNQIIYWEHFGLMDDENYRKSAGSKLDAYFSIGLVQWDNLITTYETKRRPLDAQKVRRILKAILLPEDL